MAGFTDRFSGQGLQPARVPFNSLSIAVNTSLTWPALAQEADDALADIMNVSASLANLSLYLPSASEGSAGSVTLVKNTGLFAFTVADVAGTSVANLLPGETKYIYLIDNSTQAGVWDVTIFGVGAASLDAVGAAGAGLVPIAAQLAIGKAVSEVTATRAITAADRARILVWTGGTGTLTFPLTSSLRPFNVEIRNQGSGSLTLATTGGEQIDGANSLVLSAGEALEVNAGDTKWYTVGRGRPANFNFTLLSKMVTGGTVNLTLTEAANVVQKYSGVLTSNCDVVFPSLVQVYYITNSTSGAFNLRFKTAGVGATVSIPQGQSAVLFCDGLNVINQATTIAGLSSIVFAPGSAGATPVGIGASNTGLYQSAVNEVGISSNGAQVAAFDANGLRVVGSTPRVAITATTGAATLQLAAPAGQLRAVELLTAANLRFRLAADGTAEGGANAGSNLILQRANDAGAVIDNVLSVDRATGYMTVKGIRDLARVGELAVFVGDDSLTHPFCVLAWGQLLSRAAYPELWAYVQTTTPVSEAAWTGGQFGRFSVGDGATTFRVPDLRAMVIRGLDSGRGIDTGRGWGTYQDQALLAHVHGVNDPTHVHSVNDPTHTHTGVTTNNGTHAHGYSITQFSGTGVSAIGSFGQLPNALIGAATDPNGDHIHNLTAFSASTGVSVLGAFTGVSIQSSGSAEARVRNVAYPIFIRY